MRDLLSLWFLCVALAFAGCMYTPEDGDSVGSTISSITLAGYSGAPQRTVQVYANPNPGSGSDRLLGSTTSDATKAGSLWGIDGYEWRLTTVIPDSEWACISTNTAQTYVRAYGADDLKSLNQDRVSCYGSNQALPDFLDNCVSPNSPWARITASRDCSCPPSPLEEDCSDPTPYWCQQTPWGFGTCRATPCPISCFTQCNSSFQQNDGQGPDLCDFIVGGSGHEIEPNPGVLCDFSVDPPVESSCGPLL